MAAQQRILACWHAVSVCSRTCCKLCISSIHRISLGPEHPDEGQEAECAFRTHIRWDQIRWHCFCMRKYHTLSLFQCYLIPGNVGLNIFGVCTKQGIWEPKISGEFSLQRQYAWLTHLWSSISNRVVWLRSCFDIVRDDQGKERSPPLFRKRSI